jgi:hypothetical protein
MVEERGEGNKQSRIFDPRLSATAKRLGPVITLLCFSACKIDTKQHGTMGDKGIDTGSQTRHDFESDANPASIRPTPTSPPAMSITRKTIHTNESADSYGADPRAISQFQWSPRKELPFVWFRCGRVYVCPPVVLFSSPMQQFTSLSRRISRSAQGCPPAN